MDLTQFNPAEYAAQQFEPVPDGTYRVIITATEDKVSSAGESYLQVTYTVSDGPQRNRQIYDRFFVRSTKEQVADIARRNLASLCLALGIERPQSSNDFLNRALEVTTRTKNDFVNVTRRTSIKASAPKQINTPPQPQPVTSSPWSK